MPYTIAGILKLPESGKPASGVTIKFKSKLTISPLIQQSESIITTSATGAYSISLEFSTYTVFVTLYNNAEFPAGEIILNSNTSPGQDLPTLLAGTYEPATPAWILQVQAWLNQANSSAVSAQASATTAQASANAAAVSAGQASQIAGLGTVTEAVKLAMLPLPDVWAPFTNGPKLLTGYGRDVVVGTDVVARMVDCVRSGVATYIGKDGLLKTAQANELRVERAGALIEGPNTNIWPTQFGGGGISNATIESTTLPDGTSGNSYKLTPIPGQFAFVRRPFTLTGVHTISCFAKRGDGVRSMPDIYCGSAGAFPVKMTGVEVSKGWWRMSGSLTSPTGNTGIGYGSAATETVPVFVWGFQLEAWPFATSYIPTSGVQVTRSGDDLTLPALGNILPLSCAMTMTFDTMRDVVPDPLQNSALVSLEETDKARITLQRGRYASVDSDYGFFAHCGAFGSGLTTVVQKLYTTKIKSGVVVLSVGNGKLSMRVGSFFGEVDATQASLAELGSVIRIGKYVNANPSYLYGHIRDLKIYMNPLTAEQMKAVA